MSYLDLYENSKPQNPAAVDESKEDQSQAVAPVQAKFVKQNITDALAQNILDTLDTVQAINLSRNRLTVFPQRVCTSLFALDLSYNNIQVPLALCPTCNIVELNLSNNSIADLRGLSMLASVQYLDLSENQISHIDGLENMRGLAVLKLQFNRIAGFQGLRLLSYNTSLADVWLEGNPIEQDAYFKVKLLNCVPHLKNLDGATVWRRTALQSSIVNDHLRYSDLCQRTPSTVDKYAQLSRRSASLTINDSVLQNFSSSMLTMQALPRAALQGDVSASMIARVAADMTQSTHNTTNRSSVSPSRRRASDSVNPFDAADISLLPPHLQETLVKLRSPVAIRSGRSRSPSPNKGPSHRKADRQSSTNRSESRSGGATTKGVQSPASPASAQGGHNSSNSSLPWRRSPSIAPNLATRFPKRTELSETQQSANAEAKRATSAPRGRMSVQANGQSNGLSVVTQQPVRQGAGAERPASAVVGANSRDASAAKSGRSSQVAAIEERSKLNQRVETGGGQVQQRQSPADVSPQRPDSAKAKRRLGETGKIGKEPSSAWMNPWLNPSADANSAYPLGPPPVPFDSRVMESTNSSSLLALQKSFDADQRGLARRSAASLGLERRGRTRSRDAHSRSSRRDASASGNRSVGSAGSPSGGTTPRSVSQTRSSLGRSAFTIDRLREVELARAQEQLLVEARTYSRPTSPAPYRNAAYTIHRGTASPSPRDSDNNSTYNSTVYSFSSSKIAPFSPTHESSARPTIPAGSVTASMRSSSGRRSMSPPRLTSTQRILDHYGQSGSFTHMPEVVLGLPPPIKTTSPLGKLSQNPPTEFHTEGVSSYSQETKGSSPEGEAGDHSPVEYGQPVQPEEERPKVDASPYKRLLQLRMRLSDKYAPADHQPGAHGSDMTGTVGGQPSQQFASHGEVHGQHMYDYTRRLDVHQVERMLHPAMRGPDAKDLVQVESRIQEMHEQEVTFQRMKDEYQRQLQQQYEAQLREHQSAAASLPRSPPHHAASSHSGHQSSAPGPVAQNLFYHSVALPPAPPTPPPTTPLGQPGPHGQQGPAGAGYDVLYDLIQRRRQVLGNITQPSDISPQKASESQLQAQTQGIFDAIHHLKQRQTASVDVIQSMTRERSVPMEPLRGALAQVSLQTPALHPSIQNYITMAGSPPTAPTSAAQPTGNNFLNRLTANNPYMQSVTSSDSSVAPFYPQPSSAAQYHPMPGDPTPFLSHTPNGAGDVRYTPGADGPYAPAHNVQPFVPQLTPMPPASAAVPYGRPPLPSRSTGPSPPRRAPSPRRQTPPPPLPASFSGASIATATATSTASSSLSRAIQDLQQKQAKDLRRLQSF